MQKNRDIAPLTMNSSEVKYLNFVRWEVTGSSQDCITVCNFIWKRVRAAKISVGISILIGIISDVYVMPPHQMSDRNLAHGKLQKMYSSPCF